jgi:hypothetical protein
MIVSFLIGIIITFLLALSFLFFVNAKGTSSLPPMQQTDERKTFNSLTFGESGRVEAKVLFTDRPKDGGNKVCGYIFWTCMLVQLVVGVVIVVMGNAQLVPDGVCPDGLEPLVDIGYATNIPGYCVPEDFRQDVADCYAANKDNHHSSYDFFTDEGNGFERRLQVGQPLKQGRILMERTADGKVAASIKHDLFSALHMHQFRSMARPAARKLQDARSLMDMWGGFEEYIQVPAVMFLCVAAAVPLWLGLLRVFTASVVWGTLLLNLAFIVYFAVRGEVNAMLLVVAGVYVCLLAFFRKKIKAAIDIIKIAMKGLQETPSVFAACSVCFLMYATYIAFWEISIIASAGVLQLVENPGQTIYDWPPACELKQPEFVNIFRNILIWSFIPTTFFFLNASLCCCATGIGAWYFHADDPQRPRSPAFVGLKWAFFDSTGPVFAASMIQYVVHEIRKLCTRSCVIPCDPVWLTLRILWCFIERSVQAFTKFMLLGHIFHGGGVIRTAKNSYQVLKNNLGQALTTDMVSHTVVSWSLILFSVGFGVGACAWMDSQVGEGLFAGGLGWVDQMGISTDIVVVAVCLLFTFFASYPLFSLVVIIGFAQGALTGGDDNFMVGIFTGVFFSAITSIIFRFVGRIVHNCTDVIMYCVALEKETGQKQERFEEVYNVLKDQIGQGTATNDAGAIAQGREVAAPVPAQAQGGGFCTNCGAKRDAGAAFCTSCGAKAPGPTEEIPM